MLTLHHLEKSRSFRIIWALEELEVEYQIQHYKRLPNYAAPPELKRIHPLGKSPVVTDDNLVIAESAAILDYLADRFDTQHQFKPSQNKDLTQYNYWMHYAEGSLMPLLVMTLVLSFVPPRVPFVVRPIANKILDGVTNEFIQPRLEEHVKFLEQHLAKHEYFGSSFSFADIQMSFPLIAIDERLNAKYPNIHAFVKRIKQRPAYQRAFKKDGD